MRDTKKMKPVGILGYVSTPLKTYIDQLERRNISILIPGGGNSYEAAYLLENGFTNITVVDYCTCSSRKTSSNQFEAIWQMPIQIICGDFFELRREAMILFLNKLFSVLLILH